MGRRRGLGGEERGLKYFFGGGQGKRRRVRGKARDSLWQESERPLTSEGLVRLMCKGVKGGRA